MAKKKRAGTKYRSNGYNVVVDLAELHKLFPGPPCRTLRDMTEAEICAIEKEYGASVLRPA